MSDENEKLPLQVKNIQEQIRQLKQSNSDLVSKIDALKSRTSLIDKEFVLKLENDIVSHFRAEKDLKDLMNLKAVTGELYESDITTRYSEMLKKREELYMRVLQVPTKEFYYEYLDVLFMKEKKTVNQIKLAENRPKPKSIAPKVEERLVKTENIKDEPKGQFFILPEFFKRNNLSAVQKSLKAIHHSRTKISNLKTNDRYEGKIIKSLKENTSIKINNGSVLNKGIEGKIGKKVTFKINARSEAKIPVKSWRLKPDPVDKMMKVKNSSTGNRITSLSRNSYGAIKNYSRDPYGVRAN